MVLADGDKLVRVFENLIINAIAYGNDGDYIDITAYESNNMIAIDITNYGQPIPSTDLPHIFERFIALRNRALQTLVDLDSDWQLQVLSNCIKEQLKCIVMTKTTFTVKLQPYKC